MLKWVFYVLNQESPNGRPMDEIFLVCRYEIKFLNYLFFVGKLNEVFNIFVLFFFFNLPSFSLGKQVHYIFMAPENFPNFLKY